MYRYDTVKCDDWYRWKAMSLSHVDARMNRFTAKQRQGCIGGLRHCGRSAQEPQVRRLLLTMSPKVKRSGLENWFEDGAVL